MAKEKKRQKGTKASAQSFVYKKQTYKSIQTSTSSKWWKNKQLLLLAGLVSILTFIAFSPILNNVFTNWDDMVYVTQNTLIKNLSLDGIRAIFKTPVSSNYHPVTILSYALNYRISELNPFSYMLTNLLFHIFNTVLVFCFIYLLSGKRTMLALFVSLLFGIHPMHVESVAWVSERKDVLFVFFLLLGLINYLNYLKKPNLIKYLSLLFLFILSLLSKPAAVVFPVLLILVDYYLQRKTTVKKSFLEKLPFLVLALVLGIVTFRLQSAEAVSLERFSFIHRILFGTYGFVMYIIKLFVPIKLSALHPFPENGQMNFFYYITPIIIFGILGISYRLRKNRVFIFGLGFYLISILLVLQFITVGNAIIAERYTYFPYIGLFFILGDYYDKAVNNRISFPGGKNVLQAFFVVIIVLFMIITFQRTKVWSNTETLWTDVIKKYPNSYRAYMSRGRHYIADKKYDLALVDLNRSLEINPIYAHALELRGIVYNNLKRYNLALIDLEKWRDLEPQRVEAYIHIGIALTALDRPMEALSSLNKAISFNPNNSSAFINRGVLYFNIIKDYRSALNDFNQAILTKPDYGLAYLNRARCYLILGNKAKATEDVNKAKQLGEKIPESLSEKLK